MRKNLMIEVGYGALLPWKKLILLEIGNVKGALALEGLIESPRNIVTA